jgi:hypothetical protein
MTTPPGIVRKNHEKARTRLALAGFAGFVGLAAGGAWIAATRSPWAWALIAVGVLLAGVFFGLLPRLRDARAKLLRVKELQEEQERVVRAQLAVRARVFSHPPVEPRT